MRRYTERVSFSVPRDVKSRLRRRAAVLGISMSELVRRITEHPGDGLEPAE